MQRGRDERRSAMPDGEREWKRERRDSRDHDPRDLRDRDRAVHLPPPPPLPSSSSSFLHGLPPPSPLATSRFFPPSPRDIAQPGIGLGLTDPQAWVPAPPRPGSGNNLPQDADPREPRRRWSPTASALPAGLPSHTRLPPLSMSSDYPPPHRWEMPVPTAGSAFKGEQSASDVDGHLPSPTIVNHGGPSTSTSATSQPAAGSPSPPTTSSSSTRKHQAPSSDGVVPSGAVANGSVEPPPKKKKRRQAFSCAECAKRKQKCNRETPCQHCVNRKVPHLCVPSQRSGSPSGPPARPPAVPYAPAATSARTRLDSSGVGSNSSQTTPASPNPTMSVRVTKVERMINALLNCVDGVDGSALTEWRQLHPEVRSPKRGTVPLQAPSASSLTRADTSLSESLSAPLTGPKSEKGDEWADRLDRGPKSSNPGPQIDAPISLDLDGHGAALEQVVEYAASASLQKALHDLPAKEEADKLVDFFFDKVNHFRYPLSQRLFRPTYEAVYASQGRLTSSSVLALPLIFALLALAMRLAPEEWAGPEEVRRQHSLRLYFGAQFSIMISTSLTAQNLQLVEAHILLGLYLVLMHDHRLAEGWLMFRTAVDTGLAIRLHRDGADQNHDPYMVEYRRRLWSYLYHADATYSCLLGRPPTIDTMFYDTESPSNVELESGPASEDEATVPKPMDEPTSATYLILRKRLADIVHKIVRTSQKVKDPTSYSDVVAIDALLNELRGELPPQFQMQDPDKSHDDRLWYLPIHRYYIQTEILHYTILLHRPWFLRQISTDRYALSRRACWEAAILDFEIAFHSQTSELVETLRVGSFREFSTAIIAGISLLVEPESPQAAEMENIVSSFMARHPYNKKDHSNKQGASIIHTLHERAKGRRGKASDAMVVDLPPGPINTSFERGSRPAALAPRIPRAGGSVPDSCATGDSSGRSDPTPASDTPLSGSRTPIPMEDGVEPLQLEAPSTPNDGVQALFDQFLASNEAYDMGVQMTGLGLMKPDMRPSDPLATATTHRSDLDVETLLTNTNPPPTPAGSLSAAVGDVNTSQYWDNFADGEFREHAGVSTELWATAEHA